MLGKMDDATFDDVMGMLPDDSVAADDGEDDVEDPALQQGDGG